MEEKPDGSMWDKVVTAMNESRDAIITAIKRLEDTTRRGFLAGKRRAITLAIVGTIVSISIAIFFNLLRERISNVQSGVEEVGSRVERVQKSIQARQFKITFPADGATVERTSLIRGETPFPELNHYVVVTPVKTMDNWVQPGPMNVSATGLWSGSATFGTAAVGAGQQFMVRAFATKSMVPEGTLEKEKVPEDAIFSESITVTRSK